MLEFLDQIGIDLDANTVTEISHSEVGEGRKDGWIQFITQECFRAAHAAEALDRDGNTVGDSTGQARRCGAIRGRDGPQCSEISDHCLVDSQICEWCPCISLRCCDYSRAEPRHHIVGIGACYHCGPATFHSNRIRSVDQHGLAEIATLRSVFPVSVDVEFVRRDLHVFDAHSRGDRARCVPVRVGHGSGDSRHGDDACSEGTRRRGQNNARVDSARQSHDAGAVATNFVDERRAYIGRGAANAGVRTIEMRSAMSSHDRNHPATDPDPSIRDSGVRDIGFAKLDVDRAERTGDPEVVLGAGKTPQQVVEALAQLAAAHPDRAVLVTRLSGEAHAAVVEQLPSCVVDPVGATAHLGPLPSPAGNIVIATAGTGDLPVAYEISVTARVFGSSARIVPDVGVAGLHRLLAVQDTLRAADVLVVVAGMDAALPSVVGGLVGVPIIAVPTSVGYGWNMDGLSGFLSMINSCAPGVLVVNVDNGFGAGVAAARIARAIGTARAAGSSAQLSGGHA